MPTPVPTFAVIVTVDAPAWVMPELEAHARLGVSEFPSYQGFVSCVLHRSADGTRLVQYGSWLTEEAYTACRDDVRWDALPSAASFANLVASGQARMSVESYAIVAVSQREHELALG